MAQEYIVVPKFAVRRGKYGEDIKIFTIESEAIKFADDLSKAFELGAISKASLPTSTEKPNS